MFSITEDTGSKYKFNAELYNALMIAEDEKKVIELCRNVPDHALHILSIYDETVLHLATYSKKSELVLKLLEGLPDCCLDKMTRQNKSGNTILHETATSKHARPVADKVLRRAPGLLGMRNNNGETALFYAARYGKAEIFDFLASKISSYNQASKQPFLQRIDKTTALRISILFQRFVKFSCSLAWRGKIQKEERRYESAIKLAKLLIQRDTSWELTCAPQDQSRPRIHKFGLNTYVSSDDKGIREALPGGIGGRRGGGEIDTPLFLASKSGCVHIVKEILNIYPQAIGYINEDGRNILHVAIKYRQLEIFKHIKQLETPMKQLARMIDDEGNTILHMVGKKRKDYVPEKVEGPALVLQAELLWYERVKEVMLPHFLNHRNDEIDSRRVIC